MPVSDLRSRGARAEGVVFGVAFLLLHLVHGAVYALSAAQRLTLQ